MKIAQKVILIGLDAATLGFLKKYVKEGELPNMKNIMEKGVAAEAFPALPPAANWNTIATGVYAGTHEVTAVNFHEAGSCFEADKRSTFYSTDCKVERIWETAEKRGLKPLLLKYACSWPATVKKGIQVKGFGDPGKNTNEIAPRMCFATYRLQSNCPRKHASAYKIEVK